MTTLFADYAFKDVVERPDKGAAWLPLFVFHLTMREVLDLPHKEPERNPSLTPLPLAASARFDCALIVNRVDEAQHIVKEEYSIRRNPYAIFASLGYIATRFGREGLLTVTMPGARKAHRMPFAPQDFMDGPVEVKEQAIEFYEALFSYVFIKGRRRKYQSNRMLLNISLRPALKPH